MEGGGVGIKSEVEWRGFVRMCMDVQVAHVHES